ncbi:MAG: hypothetical protein M1836_002643 [Candelina mexicana]|nr:MAG: hypothetical protein M1836_002643 [Candelina mexicana]
MFSYLRPHHKRGSSSHPTSPLPLPPPHSSDLPLHSPDFLPPPSRLHDNESRPSESPVSPVAPVLPPIPRVASRYDQITATGRAHSVQGGFEGSKDNARQKNTTTPANAQKGIPKNPRISVEEPNESTSRAGTVRPTPPRDIGGRSNILLSLPTDPESHAVSALLVPPSSSTSLYSSNKPSASTLAPQRPAPPPPRSPNIVQPSSHHFRSGKTKLNLLNPMSLLMRRRSAQGLPPVPASLVNDKALVIPAMPDDYDPRIRGTAVHDFSAPRQRRNYSTNDIAAVSPGVGAGKSPSPSHTNDGLEHSTSKVGDGNSGRTASPKVGDWDHSPMFKEQFGDDIQPWREGQTEEPSIYQGGSNSSVLSSSLNIPEPDREPPPLPPFARNLPSDLGMTSVPRPDIDNFSRSNMLPIVPETGSADISSQDLPTKSSSPGSPPKGRPRGMSGSDPWPQPAGPKRLASNASRFSFDMAGLGSATQEKIMEEKHKQHVAARKSSEIGSGNLSGARDYDDFDEDEMDDFDDLDDEEPYEEQIPGVNADVDGIQPEGGEIDAFDFSSPRTSTVASPTSPSAYTLTSPRDSSGQLIGFAMSNEFPQRSSLPLPRDSPVTAGLETSDPTFDADGLGLIGLDTVLGAAKTQSTLVAQPIDHIYQSVSSKSLDSDADEDDDLYFDDGIIEHPDDAEDRDFDESIFDLEKDAYSRSIPNLQPPRLLNFATTDFATTESSPAKYTSEGDESDSIVPQDSQSTDTTYPPFMNPAGSALSYQASMAHNHADESRFGEPSGLTQDNLAAYHNALVAAANQAVANGKFIRRDSVSDLGKDNQRAYDDEPHPGLLPDDGHFSQDTGTFSPNGFGGNEDDDFDYDSTLEDDPMIAAANAEALANDADGFYGQEFGFYAQANGTNEAHYVNGGYFGPRGPEGMVRSKSGRIILQEPNLTPITERSEYSTRNSFISLTIPGPQTNQTLPSPALAQLMNSSFGDDEDLSLSALMKLRRGAWGGSNGSLHSAGSGGSQASTSPFPYLPPCGAGGLPLANSNQLGGSSFSLASSGGVASSNGQKGSDESSVPASPTVTMANPGAVGSPKTGIEVGGSDGSSPAKKGTSVMKGGKGHSRAGSGADSVSYMKEEDTWVLERRRMSTTGEVELVGREVVAGGRI